MSKPIVAIVGRPNVGKSALFNRIVGRRVAIVEGEPGVTRDRIYSQTQWTGKAFVLVDTGGIEAPGEESVEFSSLTRVQAEMAVAEADVVLFVVDGRAGLLPGDMDVADVLRRSGKKIVLAVNKVDDRSIEPLVPEFYSLGLGDPLPVSAEHGRGIGDLLDAVVSDFPSQPDEEDDDSIRIAVVGRPNVGKSSLTNRLIGEERSIVSDVPGTTRDAIDTQVERDGVTFTLIDTAGIRRRSRIETDSVERYSVIRALRAIDRSDIALVLLDATELATEQDKRIAGYAHEAGKAIVMVVNKWDLVEKDSKTMDRFEAEIRSEFSFLQYAPILFVSALTGQRVVHLFELCAYVANQHALRIPTGRLNEVLQLAIAQRQPPSDKGKRLKVFYGVQVGVKPPSFALFVNDPRLMHFSYQRYIENQLREHFGFVGTPIVLRLRQRNN